MKKSVITKLMSAILSVGILAGTTAAVKAEGWEEYPAETWTDEYNNWEGYQAYNPYFGGYSNCTWSAWQIVYDTTGIALPDFGVAGNWMNAAARMGYTVSSVPAVNSIVCWSHHVGVVTAISEDGSMVYIKEGGYCGGYHEGWFPAYYSRSRQALYGYIWLW